MAFGPSITFVAPNWDTGLARCANALGQTIPLTPFQAWLKSLGFEQHDEPGNNFTRRPWDIYVHPSDQEVVFVMVDFGLFDADGPEQVKTWEVFAEQLCSKWGFALVDDEKEEKVPGSQFRRIVAQDSIWQLFSKMKGWQPIWPEGGGEIAGAGTPGVQGVAGLSYQQKP